MLYFLFDRTSCSHESPMMSGDMLTASAIPEYMRPREHVLQRPLKPAANVVHVRPKKNVTIVRLGPKKAAPKELEMDPGIPADMQDLMDQPPGPPPPPPPMQEDLEWCLSAMPAIFT